MRIIHSKGSILISVIVFAAIAVTVTAALVSWAGTVLRTTRILTERAQAFQAAEAGIDYYRWHLAHAQSDYSDGTGGAPGPYIHELKDTEGNVIGHYELTITPPEAGSTVVKIRSKGTMESNPDISRTIETTLAIPSLAGYAVLANDNMRFGEGTEISGPVHVNGGVRFDGLAHNLVTSSVSTYDDPDDSDHQQKFGVYTTVDPADPNPPAAVPDRPDVFEAGRQFPVPAFDFNGITSDLSNIKALAQADGRYFSSSGKKGYHIVLHTNGTFSLYKVSAIQQNLGSCKKSQSDDDSWGLWSINSQQSVGTYAYPDNGIIFLEDDTWIDGQINGNRLTIAAGKFPDNPSTRKSIIINNDIRYTNYDGSDVLGLIAQGNVNVGFDSADDLHIDGAMVAQNGRVGRYYYSSHDCGSEADRNSITLFGMIATNQRYGFAYTDGSGYNQRTINYDENLLYNPPPAFPLISDQYQTLSWQEVND